MDAPLPSDRPAPDRAKWWISCFGFASAVSMAMIVAYGALSGGVAGGMLGLGIVLSALVFIPYGILLMAVSRTGYATMTVAAAGLVFAVDAAVRVQVVFFTGSSTEAVALGIQPFVLAAFSAVTWALMEVIRDRNRPRWN